MTLQLCCKGSQPRPTRVRGVRQRLPRPGYVRYDGRVEDVDRWSLSPEQVVAFTRRGHSAFLAGDFQVVSGAAKADEKVTEAFRSERGVGWREHHHDLFTGTERRPGYAASLVSEWIPALDGVRDRLVDGGLVADVGCGHGASTILLAQALGVSVFGVPVGVFRLCARGGI